MKTLMLLLLLWCAPVMCEGIKRDYFSSMTPQEGNDIAYIIYTLGNTSPLGLLFKKTSLEQAGERIGHLHPLRFFQYILTHPQLKASFAKINGLAWRSFVDGMAGSLAKADARNNFSLKVIDDFARSSDLDAAAVQRFIDNKEWKQLIIFIKRDL